jgi:DNA (cytosine-5)-methyltransferase 1
MGWEAAFFSEIEKFPCAVLQHRYPNVPLHGDFTTIKENEYGKIDLLVGGTPCQSFSVAGLRGGLDDDRGNLSLEFCRLAQRVQPRWIVWENVPGVLSSNGGRDFGSILGALEDLGYGLAYRVLDAQYFGVAQRRRRVFVVGHLGDWRPAAAVLFESESLRRDTAPSREAGKKPAASLVPSVAGSLDTECGGGKLTHQSVANGHLIGTITARMFNALGARDVEEGAIMPIVGSLLCNTGPNGHDAGNFACNQAVDAGHVFAQPIAFHATQDPISGPISPAYCMDSRGQPQAVAQPIGVLGGQHPNAAITQDQSPTLTNAMGSGGGHVPVVGSMAVAQPIAPALTASNDPSRSPQSSEVTQQVAAVHAASMAVRRLTPVECERLQGFPDNYTAIPWRGKAETPDGPRYKALGNSMAVPVMKWIGGRINGKR